MTNSTVGTVFGAIHGGPRRHVLGGFLDMLLQGFENCRPGLSDETLRAEEGASDAFFVELYEKEVARLEETVRLFETGLPDGVQREIFETVDELVRKVVIPAYVRVARRFTIRERNDFYLLPDPLHGIERFFWGLAGMGLGGFVIWAPFIPVWQKEWVLVFVIGGLFFPDVRRYLALRRYQSELNAIVGHADDEIRRTELAHLTSGAAALGSPTVRVASADATPDRGKRPKTRQGGR
jgi:hypothetical protein